MNAFRIPGFTAEAALGRSQSNYRWGVSFDGLTSEGQRVVPQLGLAPVFGGDPDVGEYLRCRANGGGELICRFFAGLPSFTIGGVLF
jgi:hypothetical protein